MRRRLLPDGHGRLVRATLDLVASLADFATEMRIPDSAGDLPRRAGSGAVSRLSTRPGDGKNANARRTLPILTTPGCSGSTTATRTITTRITSSACALSADHAPSIHAGCTFLELVNAYYDCRQHKRNSHSALRFEQDLERNLVALHEELLSGAYRPGRSICFVILRPKPREVWAADFRDRIVHHLLYNRVAPRFHRAFIADTCACIPGRGTLYAVQRLEAKARSITQNWQRPARYLKCDLANFFVSIDKPILHALLARRIHEPWWLRLAETILYHDPRPGVLLHSSPARLALIPPHKSLFNQPGDKGLPIGNLSSQFFANVYLDVLDQFVKHTLKARYYVRYVDDFVLLHDSAQWLNQAHDRIAALLADKLAMQFNPRKTVRQPIARGIDFAGQLIAPGRRTIRRRTVNAAMQRAAAMDTANLFETANSYFGLFRQATHSKQDRLKLARLLLRRGFCVNQAFTKTYRRPA